MKPEDIQTFAKVAESLRQYRRADLKEFRKQVGESPVDVLYVDALPNDGILESVLSSHTTFLLGRKGTGKSTVFAKAQSDIRKRTDVISIYVDVKTLYDLTQPDFQKSDQSLVRQVDDRTFRAHLLRKAFLSSAINDLLREIEEVVSSFSWIERWSGKKKSYQSLITDIQSLRTRIQTVQLMETEIPILQAISKRRQDKKVSERSQENEAKLHGSLGVNSAELSADIGASDFEKTLEDRELYNEYSDIVLRSFPYQEVLTELQDLVEEAGLARLVIFFDDFSELRFVDQCLFVDVVLSPLNNSSNERIKLKVAGYPGRIYYGKIDPTKVDTILLDFSYLYEAAEIQTMESSAINYAERLLTTRFEAFESDIHTFFDPGIAFAEHMQALFQATFNVPRLMGSLLHICFLDRVSKGETINPKALRLAALKYYETTTMQYFERTNRFALEPFENKLDRFNQRSLLQFLIEEARRVRAGIRAKTIGGSYFDKLSSPPTSHFVVSPSLERMLQSLESNFFLTRYKNTRDKNGEPVIVYAFYQGLTESERMTWGYPEGRDYRNYFVQRCFEFTASIYNFLNNRQTIRCDNCPRSFPIEDRPSFERYKWRCPECDIGTCTVIELKTDFEKEIAEVKNDLLLEEIELQILNTLHIEARKMRAGEIAALLDVTYQLIGKRTSKLGEKGLVFKTPDADGTTQSHIAEKAEKVYFAE